ncbi:MAG: enoyl-CoA hydratase/isomerase family protein [Proteobacteria bacterium]|uniref:enoyl-CoA hydratase/isomerase family protein n=1 Tax=Rudaea sp. TaxID=2136325 RepID=UPI003782E72E|nr:enoyl-CoA hydratase/isomerase family protein [Pseudomonadota bacterium]
MLEQLRHDDILELRLARPPVNAFNLDLSRALREAIEAAPDRGARGIVLCGRPGMFSAGLDVASVLELDAAGRMGELWREYSTLCRAIAASSVPIVVAIAGHAPAGGAVLATFCDYRVMARGAFRIGLNETQVGLSVPPEIQTGLRRLVGAYRAERLMVAGTMLDSEEALRIGFVDELAEPDEVAPRAFAWLRALLALPPQAMTKTRAIARADVVSAFDAECGSDVDAFVRGWFGDESRATLKAVLAKLKSKA